MRIQFGNRYVSLIGGRKIFTDEGTHIGAVIDEETRSFVQGPYVLDRTENIAVGEAHRYIGGTVPMFHSLSEEQYQAIQNMLDMVATELGIEFQRC